jgi:hypothetical protein
VQTAQTAKIAFDAEAHLAAFESSSVNLLSTKGKNHPALAWTLPLVIKPGKAEYRIACNMAILTRVTARPLSRSANGCPWTHHILFLVLMAFHRVVGQVPLRRHHNAPEAEKTNPLQSGCADQIGINCTDQNAARIRRLRPPLRTLSESIVGMPGKNYHKIA